MSKSPVIAACLLGAAALLAQVASADEAKPTAHKVAKAAAPTAGCTQQTGSRIPRKDGCAGVGRSYGSEDIQRTGATTAGGALRLMDPAISGR